MEVHMRGIPEFLGQDALHKHLEPIMASLGIDKSEFVCDKPRRAKWANLTFGLPSHGQTFLANHGERSVPAGIPQTTRRPPSTKTSSRVSANGSVNVSFKNLALPAMRRKSFLQLMGNDVYCSISKNCTPNPITMRALQHAAEERLHPTRRIETDGSPEIFALRSLSCGLSIFEGNDLAFVPEIQYRDLTGVAKFSKRFLLITLQKGLLAIQKVIRIPLDTVVSLVYSSPNLLTLTLSEEPSFFEQEPELSSVFALLSLGAPGADSEKTQTRICSLDKEHGKVVGHCLVYQLEVSETDLHRKIAALENHHIVPFVRYHLTTAHSSIGVSSETAMGMLMKELMAYTQYATLPFEIIYQLQALAWNAYLHPRTVLELAKKLKEVFRLDQLAGRHQISVESMKRLFKTTGWPQPNGDPLEFNVSSLVKRLREYEDEIRKASAMRRGLSSPTQNLALIYRITVTPSRTTLHGPELDSKNRVLKKFPNHHDYFARVQFCDENGQDLFYNGKISYEPIYEKFKHVFQTGIQIAGRRYMYLGYSHSSLRSHSAWVCYSFPSGIFVISF